jgi:hypothetical protein
VADGVTDPVRLRQLTVESLLPGHWRARSAGTPIIRADFLAVVPAEHLSRRRPTFSQD